VQLESEGILFRYTCSNHGITIYTQKNSTTEECNEYVLVKTVAKTGMCEFVEGVPIGSNDYCRHPTTALAQVDIFIVVSFPSRPIDIISPLKLASV